MSPLERVRVPERMDRPDAPPDELRRALADLRLVNRWLAGARPAVSTLFHILEELPDRPIRILDVGTGSADIPLRVAAAAARRSIDVCLVATDLHPETVAIARERAAAEPRVRVERANALALEYPDRSFDVAMCHTTLHHFDEVEAVRALEELGRVAAQRVLVTDLIRSRWNLLGVALLAWSVWKTHPITRHDGPASVRAAFTPAEALDLARRAGLRSPRIRRSPLLRWCLIAEPPAPVDDG